ncbi:MAG TPA: 16S rRNA (uracil(1498)-N(3))-methyltransferase [Stellaceae bacterium]|nr:16S rRNA (uracil(1498)-N(3))-methyltransferase [Stellaceae bacterium]
MAESIAARLYVTVPLAAGAKVTLDEGQAHYLRHVLRLGPGDFVAVFNGRDGEWSACIFSLGKRDATLAVELLRRPQQQEADLWLVFAPVKRAPIDAIAEKATELGVSALWPVMTRRTVPARVNLDRLAAQARAAAEQSERLSVPEIRASVPLDKAIAAWPADRRLIVCDESGRAPPAAEVLAGAPASPGGWAILTGPEGGFAPGELDAVLKLASATSISLGPRVLRADTAAIAAVAVFQALAGDWRQARRPV